MTRPFILLALVTLTFLGGWRSLQVGHLSDDWVNVSHVSRHGSAEAFVKPWLGMGEKSVLWHRPLLMVLYDADVRMFGVNPGPAHVHHMLWHALAVCLLHGIMRRLGSSRAAAFLGALLFAWHPYLAGTTGWLAARCGTVAGTFTLLSVFAWLVFRDSGAGRGRLAYVTAIVACVAAALTQESGYLALLAPLTIDLCFQKPRPGLASLARTHLPFAIAGLALLGLRYAALGTLRGGYPYAQGVLAGGDAAVTALQDLGSACLRLVCGAPPAFLFAGWALPAACGLLTVAVFAWGRGADWKVSAARLLGLLACTQVLILLLVSDAVLAPTTGQRWYVALAFWCALLARSATSLMHGRQLVIPILLAALFLAGHLQVQDHLVRADARARKVLAEVMEELDRAEVARGPLLVSGLPESSLGLPVFQWGFAEALRPPFQEKDLTRPVYPILRFMSLGSHGTHPFHPPLEVLLFLEGKQPTVLNLIAEDSDQLARFDFRKPDGAPISREEVTAFLRQNFAAERLRATSSVADNARIGIEGLSLPIRVETAGLQSVEFFVFLPTVNMRTPFAVGRGDLRVDLGPQIEDYARFRGEEVTLYIMMVGFVAQAGAPPHLGQLLTWTLVP